MLIKIELIADNNNKKQSIYTWRIYTKVIVYFGFAKEIETNRNEHYIVTSLNRYIIDVECRIFENFEEFSKYNACHYQLVNT